MQRRLRAALASLAGELPIPQVGVVLVCLSLTARTLFGQATFTTLSAGNDFTCGLAPGGVAYCWGANTLGQLGTGSPDGSTTPVAVAGGITFTAISAGNSFACGVAADGHAYCWGNRRTNAIGDGKKPAPRGRSPEGGETQTTPVQVQGELTFSTLSAGQGGPLGTHACGLVRLAAHCWGENSVGQLGDGSRTKHTAPQAVIGGLSFKTVSAGGSHTCAVTMDLDVFCWGDNRYGQLGNRSQKPSSRPVPVVGGRGFISVSAGADFSCGVKANGTALCWGSNTYGQLGAPVTTECTDDLGRQSSCSLVPVLVSGKHWWVEISVGSAYACGRTTRHEIYCWGQDDTSQLGTGSPADSCKQFATASLTGPCLKTPTQVAGVVPFSAVTAGARHTCALAADGAAYCWGEGKNGELGNGATAASAVPVRVSTRP